MDQTLSDLMTDEVVYLLPDQSAQEAAAQMKALNVGIIPICDAEKRLLGVVTDRDIVLRVVAEGRDAGATALRDIATMDPVAGQRGWDVAAAVEMMSRYQIRRLPIVEGGRLVGIVSLGDLAVQGPAAATAQALGEISQPALPRVGGSDPGDQVA